MTNDDLCYASASELLRLYSECTVSPREVIEAQISRAERYDPLVTAFTEAFVDNARRAADMATDRWRKGNARALEGLTLGVKDAQNVLGQRTTYGSSAFAKNVADATDPMLRRLFDAGAIELARTTTSELCLSGVCRSSLWGVSHNPWNRAFGPGGSSGGSAAALAAGFVTLATGTDMGGSIRVPASACGVAGFKPPHGRNPDAFPARSDPFSVCGPLAREVGDLILMQNVTAGRHPQDPYSLPLLAPLSSGVQSVKGLKLALSYDLSYKVVDPEVRDATQNAADVFRNLGCEVDEVDLCWTTEIDQMCTHWFNVMWCGRTLVNLLERSPQSLTLELQAAAMEARATRTEDILRVFECIDRMYARLGSIFERSNALICPTMTIPAVPVNLEPRSGVLRINGVPVDPEFGYSTTHQFNMISSCPALSVPSGRASSGVPIGLQIVGHPFDDVTVIRLGAAYEAARGFWYRSDSTRPSF